MTKTKRSYDHEFYNTYYDSGLTYAWRLRHGPFRGLNYVIRGKTTKVRCRTKWVKNG